jgi:hypothetical protein
VHACVHRGECVRVCVSVFDCTMFRKKKIKFGESTPVVNKVGETAS